MTAIPTHPAIEDCLFHYTSAQGLKGILETRQIWATDAAFLNDSSEVRYAGDAVEQHLLHLIGQFKLDNPHMQPGSAQVAQLALLESARDALVKFINADEYSASAPYVEDGATYVSCLTEEPDQLSQWRGYGGRGYAIGFKRDALNDLEIDGEDPTLTAGKITPVGYGKSGLDALRTNVSQFFYHRPPAGHPGSTGFFDTVNSVLPWLAKVKHGAFDEEKEWRLIVSRYGNGPAKKLYFREGGRGRLVPYLRLNFARSAVAYVYIGPGGDFNDRRALRAFLRTNGYEVDPTRARCVYIEQSDAPFDDS